MAIFKLKEMVLSEVYGLFKDSIAVKELETVLRQFEVGGWSRKGYIWFLFFYCLSYKRLKCIFIDEVMEYSEGEKIKKIEEKYLDSEIEVNIYTWAELVGWVFK